MMSSTSLKGRLAALKVLAVDQNAYMRRVTRMMLSNIGVKSVFEADDGVPALQMIRTCDPDVMLLDWDLPNLSGMEIMRIVRSPGAFPRPNLPIIMLTTKATHRKVQEAVRWGVHEYLVKPTSPQALYGRLTSVVMSPRPMVEIEGRYIPIPRETARPNTL